LEATAAYSPNDLPSNRRSSSTAAPLLTKTGLRAGTIPETEPDRHSRPGPSLGGTSLEDWSAVNTAAAFQFAFTAARVRLGGTNGGGGIDTAEQMFEAPTPERRGSHRAAAEAIKRGDVQSEPLTSVSADPPENPHELKFAARREQHSTRNQQQHNTERNSQPPIGNQQSGPGASSAETPPASRTVSLPNVETPGRPADFSQSKPHCAETSVRTPPSRIVSARGSPATPGNGHQSDPLTSVSADLTGPEGPRDIKSAAGRGQESSNVAERVGRILAGSRSGQTESARSSTASASEDRAPQANRKTPDSVHASRGTGDVKTDAPESDSAPSPLLEFDRLIRALRVRTGTRHFSARLQLDPPDLGRLWVDVHMHADKLRVYVRTETEIARELLRERAAHLKAALQQHGLVIDGFDVTLDILRAQTPKRQDAETPTRTRADFGAARGRWDRSARPAAVGTGRRWEGGLDVRA